MFAASASAKARVADEIVLSSTLHTHWAHEAIGDGVPFPLWMTSSEANQEEHYKPAGGAASAAETSRLRALFAGDPTLTKDTVNLNYNPIEMAGGALGKSWLEALSSTNSPILGADATKAAGSRGLLAGVLGTWMPPLHHMITLFGHRREMLQTAVSYLVGELGADINLAPVGDAGLTPAMLEKERGEAGGLFGRAGLGRMVGMGRASTPLVYAVQLGLPVACEVLLANGAYVNNFALTAEELAEGDDEYEEEGPQRPSTKRINRTNHPLMLAATTYKVQCLFVLLGEVPTDGGAPRVGVSRRKSPPKEEDGEGVGEFPQGRREPPATIIPKMRRFCRRFTDGLLLAVTAKAAQAGEAVDNNAVRVFELLLRNGFPPNQRDTDEGTAINGLLRRQPNPRTLLFVERLLEAGLDVTDEDVSTRLHSLGTLAVQPDTAPLVINIIDALLRHGVDVNALNGPGYTPIAAAITNGRNNLSTIEHLSKCGGMFVVRPPVRRGVKPAAAAQDAHPEAQPTIAERVRELLAKNNPTADAAEIAQIVAALDARGAELPSN